MKVKTKRSRPSKYAIIAISLSFIVIVLSVVWTSINWANQESFFPYLLAGLIYLIAIVSLILGIKAVKKHDMWGLIGVVIGAIPLFITSLALILVNCL